jgi:hypothetical protein
MEADMDALARAARCACDELGERRLWRAVLELPSWYFVALGEEREPYVVSVEGWPRLLSFTRRERAEAFARGMEAGQGIPLPSVLEMSVSEALDRALGLLSYDVESILFNPGEHAFSCPIASLVEIHRPTRRFP